MVPTFLPLRLCTATNCATAFFWSLLHVATLFHHGTSANQHIQGCGECLHFTYTTFAVGHWHHVQDAWRSKHSGQCSGERSSCVAGLHLLAFGLNLGAPNSAAEEEGAPLVLLCFVPGRQRPQKLSLLEHTYDVSVASHASFL